MIDVDSPAFKKFWLSVALLFFVVPTVLVIAYQAFAQGFLHSGNIKPWLVPVAAVFGLAALSITLPIFAVRARVEERPMLLLLIPICALFGSAIGLMFLGGPLPYLLHLSSNPKPAITLETVTHLSTGAGRRNTCSRSVTFASDVSVFRRRICRASEDMFRILKVGDTLELHGTSSQFGMLVASYKKPVEG